MLKITKITTLRLYRKISEEKLTKTNILLKIFDIIHILEAWVEQQNNSKNFK